MEKKVDLARAPHGVDAPRVVQPGGAGKSFRGCGGLGLGFGVQGRDLGFRV